MGEMEGIRGGSRWGQRVSGRVNRKRNRHNRSISKVPTSHTGRKGSSNQDEGVKELD
jgi:hypothetical protein